MLNANEVDLLRQTDRAVDRSNPTSVFQRHVIAILGYVVFGVLWIGFSDEMMHSLVTDNSRELVVGMWKGWAFILCSGLYFAINLMYRTSFGRRRWYPSFRALRESIPFLHVM